MTIIMVGAGVSVGVAIITVGTCVGVGLGISESGRVTRAPKINAPKSKTNAATITIYITLLFTVKKYIISKITLPSL